MLRPWCADSRRGSTILELALSLSVLGPLGYAGAKTAYAVHQTHEIQAAVERGARYGSARPEEAEIRNVTVYGNPEGLGSARIGGLRPEHVRVEFDEEDGRRVRVSVHGFRVSWPGRTVILDGKPAASFPVTGQ